MKASAILSNAKVVTPGLISLAIMPKVMETNSELWRINSISSLVLGIIMVKKLKTQS
jgi:hypothetical protein